MRQSFLNWAACMEVPRGCQSATILNQQLAENGRQFDEQQKRELAIQMQRQQQEYDADQRKRDRRAAAFRDWGDHFSKTNRYIALRKMWVIRDIQTGARSRSPSRHVLGP